MLRVSAIACALPWVRELSFDPVVVGRDSVEVPYARASVDPKRKPAPGYRHMAIHPYPFELESTIALRDGTQLAMRPVRPEDAELERRFVAGLSEQTRYYRFFYRLHELSPAMLARFTQVDYDRELALLALAPGTDAAGESAMVGIARSIANLDNESAEFAVVTADEWQGRGVATALMKALIAHARKKGLRRLLGTVLRANHNMVRFTQGLGFTIRDDPEDPDQVVAELDLALTAVNAGEPACRYTGLVHSARGAPHEDPVPDRRFRAFACRAAPPAAEARVVPRRAAAGARQRASAPAVRARGRVGGQGGRAALLRRRMRGGAGAGRALLEEAGIPFERVQRIGEPAVEIGRFATEWGADLIAMGRHGYSAVTTLLMGSVAQKVIATAGVPVLLLR